MNEKLITLLANLIEKAANEPEDVLYELKGEPGKAGRGIKSVRINADYELIVRLDDGTNINAGKLPKGDKGDSGKSIKGDPGESIKGDPGAPGLPGKDGNGVKEITISADQDLIFTLDDGTRINAGKIPESKTGAAKRWGGGGTTKLYVDTAIADAVAGLMTNPMTTLGDIIYQDASAPARLAGNISATQKFLSQTGNGVASAAPAWSDAVTTVSVADANGFSGTVATSTTTPEITIIPGRNYKASLSNGIHEGLQVTINADPSKINIAAGTYTIVDDWTDPQNPVVYDVTYAGATGVTVTYLATNNFSYILLDTAGSIVQLSSTPTGTQHRSTVTLAQLGHTNRTSIASVNPQVEVFACPVEQLRDYWNFFSIASKANIISANGANLSINKSLGYLFAPGANFYTNPEDPHVVEIAAASPATFRRRTQTGNGANGATTIDPGNYDVAGTITAIVGTKYTNQRVYLFPNGNLIVQYGQELYSNMSNAIAAIPNESYTVYANTVGNAAFIGVISVRSTATDLSSTAQAIFTRIDATSGFPSGSSGTSTTTLQQAYENSTEPEILTDSTRGAVTLRRGSAADTDTVLEVLSGAGSVTFSVTGEGSIGSAIATTQSPGDNTTKVATTAFVTTAVANLTFQDVFTRSFNGTL